MLSLHEVWFNKQTRVDCTIVVEQNLVACVKFLHNMTSIYKWKDELEAGSA